MKNKPEQRRSNTNPIRATTYADEFRSRPKKGTPAWHAWMDEEIKRMIEKNPSFFCRSEIK
jgi:hypothetical protein